MHAIAANFEVLNLDPGPDYVDPARIIPSIDQASATFVILLRPGVQIIEQKFWDDIDWLLAQNQYLDVLKHQVWIAFNRQHVLFHADKDYWNMNLRPAHFFDDSTWHLT